MQISKRDSKGRTSSLYTEAIYCGQPSDNEVEKDARRVLGLPLTKGLVYYPSSFAKHPIPVEKYCVREQHPSYLTIEIELINGVTTLLHQEYLKEMQLPTFIKDNSNFKSYWTTKDGETIDVKKMATPHIQNSIAVLERMDTQYGSNWIEIFEEELARRKANREE